MPSTYRYPALRLLLAGYLNQDWDLDYDDVWDAVADFATSEPIAHHLSTEVGEVRKVHDSDEALRVFVADSLGSGYLPVTEPCGDWLEEVARRVEQHVRGSQ